jgi:hypothetical protein
MLASKLAPIEPTTAKLAPKDRFAGGAIASEFARHLITMPPSFVLNRDSLRSFVHDNVLSSSPALSAGVSPLHLMERGRG